MDDTLTGQNLQPQQPQDMAASPVAQVVPPQIPVAQPTEPILSQVPTSPPAPIPSPIPPVVAPQPVAAVPTPIPTPKEEGKITLDDLYGPSGFAKDEPEITQPLPVPTSLPVATPEEPAPQSEVVQQPTPVSEMPLRKPSFPEPSVSAVVPPQVVTSAATTLQEDVTFSDTGEGGKPGINKLFLLRIIFGVLGALVVLFLLITIGKALFSHPAASGKATLTYWGLWEDSNTMQGVITEFEKDHPDVTIHYQKEDPKQYSQRLLTRIQQGDGPDIFTYHSSWLPMMQATLLPLPTTVVSKADLENNFYPVVRTDLVKNGALYGLPLEVDTLALFVNNTIFKSAHAQVPTSWDTFASTAQGLTQKDANGKIKIAGAALGTFDNITHAPDIISALFVQNGVDIPTMAPASNASDALSFYTSFASGSQNVWDNTLDPSQLAFAKGNLAMYFGYSWDIFAIKANNPNLDFSVHPIPHLPGRNTTVASYWVQGVSAKSTHQKEALEFLAFLSQKNTMAALYAEEAKTRLFGEPYARSDLGLTVKDNLLVYPFLQQATDATSSFFAGETGDAGINAQMNGYLGNAVKSILSDTSADSAVDTLSKGVQQVENQYGPQ